ncbi:hypothetical protein GGR56DRAFT_638302 [Xylariaceae sp. FL0804]|nr:hypothetical protein GGR56DRAFT_638302 [Xylariaceae sp. FL0804]
MTQQTTTHARLTPRLARLALAAWVLQHPSSASCLSSSSILSHPPAPVCSSSPLPRSHSYHLRPCCRQLSVSTRP